jgi:single-strand DNA-binding protein
MNKVVIVGNLGKDPETRMTKTGSAVCNFPVATSNVWKDENGERQEQTQWHSIVAFGTQADTCGKYLNKGRQVAIDGEIRYRSYENDEGEKKYVTEIVANKVEFLGSAPQ